MAPPRKITDEQINEMCALYAAGGVTQADIALRYDLSQQRVSFILLSRGGVSRPGPYVTRHYIKLTDAQRSEARALYAAGEGTITELAREFDVCHETMRKIVSRHAKRPKKSSLPRPSDVPEDDDEDEVPALPELLGPIQPERRPGFPKTLPCLRCGRMRTTIWPGDRLHAVCRQPEDVEAVRVLIGGVPSVAEDGA